MTKDHLKAILAGKKQLLKKADVNYVTVTKYDEISVKAMWPMLKKDPVFMSYFPDKYAKGKNPPRDYFFNVLNTLQPDYFKQVIDHANKERMTGEGEKMKAESI